MVYPEQAVYFVDFIDFDELETIKAKFDLLKVYPLNIDKINQKILIQAMKYLQFDSLSIFVHLPSINDIAKQFDIFSFPSNLIQEDILSSFFH
jgi:hypothetical protein